MVNLRSLAQLDYNQLHNSGRRRSTPRRSPGPDAAALDHGYCLTPGQYLLHHEYTGLSPVHTTDPWEAEASPGKSRFELNKEKTGPKRREVHWDLSSVEKPGLETMREAVPGYDVLKRTALDPGAVAGLLGPGLGAWEEDPDLVERVHSLGEVLGLARDLNISLEGMDLGVLPPSGPEANPASTHMDGTGDVKNSRDTTGPQDDVIDVPDDVMDFLMEATMEARPDSALQFGSSTPEVRNRKFTAMSRQQASGQLYKSGGKGATPKSKAKRGRKPAKIDVKAKLERSRQSARECRARKKLRYQYLEELVSSRERAVFQLRSELEQFKKWASELDAGVVPTGLEEYLSRERRRKERSTSESSTSSYVIRSRRRLTTDPRESESSDVSAGGAADGAASPVHV